TNPFPSFLKHFFKPTFTSPNTLLISFQNKTTHYSKTNPLNKTLPPSTHHFFNTPHHHSFFPPK
ncbi:hypothetical protein, partial [Bacillus subtilis]|uniref:hypothetical protein n=1 Tax=Bacillus subtilis TaxID=1423 RepID=UPI001BDB9EDC